MAKLNNRLCSVHGVKCLLKRALRGSSLSNWNKVLKNIQRDLQLEPLLSGKSSVEVVYSFQPNTRFNNLYQQMYQEPHDEQRLTTHLKKEADENFPRIGKQVWYRNAPHKTSTYNPS